MACLSGTALLVLVTLIVLKTARASGVRQTLYEWNAGMDGLRPTAPALFQASAISTVRCGIQCSKLDGCRSFTLSGDQPYSCRGYDVFMTSPNSADTEPAAGATSFVITDWLETPCSADSECPEEKSECFKGLCLCSPGNYYSAGNRTCLADCQPTDLGGRFVKYKETYALVSLFSPMTPGVSLSECQEQCLHVTNCRSVTYIESVSFCYPMQYTPLNETEYTVFLAYDYYQRTCF